MPTVLVHDTAVDQETVELRRELDDLKGAIASLSETPAHTHPAPQLPPDQLAPHPAPPPPPRGPRGGRPPPPPRPARRAPRRAGRARAPPHRARARARPPAARLAHPREAALRHHLRGILAPRRHDPARRARRAAAVA